MYVDLRKRKKFIEMEYLNLDDTKEQTNEVGEETLKISLDTMSQCSSKSVQTYVPTVAIGRNYDFHVLSSFP